MNKKDLKDLKNLKKYESSYNEDDLFSKISKFASKAGVDTIYYALILYHLVVKNYNPVAIGALGYFILPIDVLPDFMFGVGYVDDAFVLGLALTHLASQITPDIKKAAKKDLKKWMDFDEKDLPEDYR